MLRPTIEARITQELQLKPTDAVLEIGSGSGYQAALLGHLAQQVTSVEINRSLATFALDNIEKKGMTNVKFETGDASAGCGITEFDAILMTGSLTVVFDDLK